jgi:hypothetical protein
VRTMRRLPAIGTGILALLLMAGCAGPVTAPFRGLTCAQAVRIVRRYLAGEAAAEATWNVADQNTLEMPPQSIIDDATWNSDSAANVTPTSGGNGARYAVSVMVPADARVFEALSDGVYMVFRQRHGRWYQMYSPVASFFAPVLVPVVDGSGHTLVLSASQYSRLKLTPSEAADRYAADLQSAVQGVDGGDSAFTPGPFTSAVMSSLAAQRSPGAQVEANGSPAPYPVYAFALKGGGALVFLAVELVTTTVAPPGHIFLIAPDSFQSGLIPPGVYVSVTSTSYYDLAIVDPPAGSSRRLQVVGSSSGTVSDVGVPGTPGLPAVPLS